MSRCLACEQTKPVCDGTCDWCMETAVGWDELLGHFCDTCGADNEEDL